MSGCETRDAYLDRRLDPQEQVVFDRHAASCPSCQEAITRWQRTEAALRDAVTARDGHARPLPSAARLRLARSDRATSSRLHRRAGRWAAGGVAIAAVAAVGALILRAPVVLPTGGPAYELRVTGASGTVEASRRLEAPPGEPTVASLGPDTLALAPGTSVDIAQATERRTRLFLRGPRGAFSVAHSRPRDFRVALANGWEVRVTGTTFAVAQEPDATVVEVVAGSVDVVDARDERLAAVRAGHRARFEASGTVQIGPLPEDAPRSPRALVRAPAPVDSPRRAEPATPASSATPKPSPQPAKAPASERGREGRRESAGPSLQRWRRAASQGRCDEIRDELRTYLRAPQTDPRAWSLFGDCERKAGRGDTAYRAYRHVIGSGDTELAMRARYLAAEIALDDLDRPRAAAALLEAYLSREPAMESLTAGALLRLGRAWATLGEVERARDRLLEVARRFPGTPAARQAEALLERLDR